MVAAVHLDEEAGLGHALPVAAMAWRAAGAWTADPSCTEEPLDGRAREVQGFALGEELRKVAIVAALVDGAGQGEDPGPDGVSEAAPGGAAAVAMSQGGEALPAEFGKEPTHMPQ